MKFSRNFPESFPKFFRNFPESFPKFFRNFPEISCNFLEIFPKFSWNLWEIFFEILGNLQEIFEKFSGNLREIFEKSPRNLLEIFEKSSRSFREVFEKCLGNLKKNLWEIFKKSSRNLWEIFEKSWRNLQEIFHSVKSIDKNFINSEVHQQVIHRQCNPSTRNPSTIVYGFLVGKIDCLNCNEWNWHIQWNEHLALELSYDLGLGCSPLFCNSIDYDSSYPWIRLRFVHLIGVRPVQTYCWKTNVSISLPSPTSDNAMNMSIGYW